MASGFQNEFKSAADIASALQWVRFKSQGGNAQDRPGAMLLLAIGGNCISASMDPKLDPEDALEILQGEIDTIAQLLRYMKETKRNYHFISRGK